MEREASNDGRRSWKGFPTMSRWLLLALALLLAIALVQSATAQDPNLADRDQEFAASINNPLTIGPNETIAVAIGVHNDTIVDGTVHDLLIVIDGTAIINGDVKGPILAFSSHIVLGPTARVSYVSLQNSTIEVSPSAVVTDRIEEHGRFFILQWWSSPVFALILWLLTTVFLMAGGIIFTLAAGHQFPVFVSATSGHVGRNLVTSLIVWIGIPVVALLVMLTLIGIPLGLVLLGLVLPGLWWLGYTVVGARLGSWILGLVSKQQTAALAVASTLLGMLLLQLLTLLPYLGGLAIFLSGAYGAGALVGHLTKGRHERPLDPELAAFGPEFSRASSDLRMRN
jgi:hypothetical protein